MPNTSPHERHEFTLDQVEQLGRVLTPAIQNAMRPQFAELKDEVTSSVGRESREIKKKLDDQDKEMASISKRVTAIERFHIKTVGIWIGASGAVAAIVSLITNWIKGH